MTSVLEQCLNQPLPNGFTCTDSTSLYGFFGCFSQSCPAQLTQDLGAQFCLLCLQDVRPGESIKDLYKRCTNNYDPVEEKQCLFAGGGADTVIVSRHPILKSNFFQFPRPVSPIINYGISYAQVEAPNGPVDVYCPHLYSFSKSSDFANDPTKPLNLAQANILIDLIKTNSKRDVLSLVFGDFNISPGAPGLTSIWEDHYQLFLQNNFKPAFTTPECTWGCTSLSEILPSQLDHIFSFGKTKVSGVYGNKNVCFKNNTVSFREPLVPVGPNTFVHASDHFAVSSTVCAK